MRERLERHRGWSVARQLRLELWIVSSDSDFCEMVAHLENDGVAARHASITDVVVSASGSLEMDSQAIVKM